ncbi:MAG: hypothetical protein KDD55_11840 [Bdellovibrionales bacterium]|nr:hypothetical protein [Bdellovibrionales bacterium]
MKKMISFLLSLLSVLLLTETSAHAMSRPECYREARKWGNREARLCIQDHTDENGHISTDTAEACVDFGDQVAEIGRKNCESYFKALRKLRAKSAARRASGGQSS